MNNPVKRDSDDVQKSVQIPSNT